jgi:hypothetical protein
MREEIRVLPMGPGEFAAEVDEGAETTRHRVLLPAELSEILGRPNVEESVIVEQALRCLLDRTPNTALPHDIDLAELDSRDSELFNELRARIAG